MLIKEITTAFMMLTASQVTSSLPLPIAHIAQNGAEPRGTDDNPGILDSPSCVSLVKAQLSDQGVDPDRFDIEYKSSQKISDGNGGVNSYLLTNKTSKEQISVTVGLYFAKVEGDKKPAPSAKSPEKAPFNPLQAD